MTENTVKTHKCEDVRWTPCGNCKGDDGLLCADCGGITGLRFPGLSQECTYGESIGASHPGKGRNCFGCDGRGRVPVDTLDSWLDAADTLGSQRIVFVPGTLDGKTLHCVDVMIKGERYYGMAQPTRLEAIQEAVCRGTQSHEEKSK